MRELAGTITTYQSLLGERKDSRPVSRLLNLITFYRLPAFEDDGAVWEVMDSPEENLRLQFQDEVLKRVTIFPSAASSESTIIGLTFLAATMQEVLVALGAPDRADQRSLEYWMGEVTLTVSFLNDHTQSLTLSQP